MLIEKKIKFLKLFFLVTVIFSCFISTNTFASSATPKTLGDVASQIILSMENVARLITAVSYVVGIGFAMMGLLKLKAHKDNPTQVPLSQSFVLLIISAGLIYLPSVINMTGQTIWQGGVQASADGRGLEQTSML